MTLIVTALKVPLRRPKGSTFVQAAVASAAGDSPVSVTPGM